MKKLGALLLALSMIILSLSACNQKQTMKEKEKPAVVEQQKSSEVKSEVKAEASTQDTTKAAAAQDTTKAAPKVENNAADSAK